MSTARSGNLGWRYRLTLKFAEELREKCNRYDQQLSLLYTGGLAVAITWVVAELLLYFNPPVTGWLNYMLMAAACAYALLAGSLLYTIRQRVLRSRARDRRALYRIVDMWREVLPGLEKSGRLAGIETQELRIRLARFDIGPGDGTLEEKVRGPSTAPPAEQGVAAPVPVPQTHSPST